MSAMLSDDVETSPSMSRKIFCKNAFVTFADNTPAKVRTTDISFFDVYVASPVHAKQKSTCWLDLFIPASPEENVVFTVKGLVISCVYSKSIDGFKLGLAFVSPSANLLRSIQKLK